MASKQRSPPTTPHRQIRLQIAILPILLAVVRDLQMRAKG
ncbi:hypothetical protein ES332_D07G251000v1 [Gossypium tomentosum]|uniref:Uncharacterized protein n=1 Tax=Gossypium tomentosum TaxID=34277 RepID=A0A5D2IX91_GOSTO|nr:hypothetical protein ES332_D11G400000v1 [Gossypium tomentosum]TYH64217.1 hypothetical protein ES332_D07G251000v1 [Gossypium tomentosum]